MNKRLQNAVYTNVTEIKNVFTEINTCGKTCYLWPLMRHWISLRRCSIAMKVAFIATIRCTQFQVHYNDDGDIIIDSTMLPPTRLVMEVAEDVLKDLSKKNSLKFPVHWVDYDYDDVLTVNRNAY